jgi:hypothetical protein
MFHLQITILCSSPNSEKCRYIVTLQKYNVVFDFWCLLSPVIIVHEVHVAIIRHIKPPYEQRECRRVPSSGIKRRAVR